MITQGFISKEGLLQLKKYQYHSGKWTILDNIMNHYWEQCIKLVPLWVAPNLITFIGWIFVILSYSNMLVYDYTFTKQIPSWCFIFTAFCIFVYSTLDAIDGKQARRTKSGSPLGQLFDHGCDSFSMTFFILAICQATRPSVEDIFLIYMVCQISFYTSNWMEYRTGILQTSVGQFGVTEAEFSCALIHLATGILGQGIWQSTIKHVIQSILGDTIGSIITNNQLLIDYSIWDQLLNLQLNSAFVYGYSLMIGSLCIYSIISTTWKSVGNRRRCLAQFISIGLIAIMELIWMKMQIYQKYNGLILVNFGLLSSFLVCKIIICSVTKMKFQYFHDELIVFLIATTIMSMLDLKGNLDGMIIIFWICFCMNILTIIRFLYLTIRQITLFLGIYCFSLQKRSPIQDAKLD